MEEHLSQGSAGHETKDASVRPIVLTGAALAVVIVIAGLVVYGAFHYLAAHRATSVDTNPMSVGDSQVPPEPQIQEHPMIEVQQLRTHEDRTLSTYGWVDKKAGVVRVPIDRAMELQLRRGFPTRKEQIGK